MEKLADSIEWASDTEYQIVGELDPKPRKKLVLSDAGNRDRLIELYGDQIRYVPEKTWDWLYYDNGVWVKGDDGHAKAYNLAEKAVLSFNGDIQFEPDQRLQEKIRKHAVDNTNDPKLESCLRSASKNPRIKISFDKLDTHANLLNFKNGILNLESGKFLEHKSSYLITCQMNVDYKPDAQAPTFEAGMQLMFGEAYPFVIRLLGYSLFGRNEAKIIPILCSPPNGGKSTLVNIISSVIGNYFQTCDKSVLTGMVRKKATTQELYDLVGKRLLVCNEMTGKDCIDIGLVKMLAGNDRIRMDRKYGSHIETTLDGVFWLAANELPKIPDGGDDAIWDRLKVIEFKSIPKDKRIYNYEKLCLAEAEGIARLLVDGAREYVRLRDSSPVSDGIQCPESVQASGRSYREESDSVEHFLNHCTVREGEIHTESLYNAYLKYCKDRFSADDVIMKQHVFGKAVAKKGYENDVVTIEKKRLNGFRKLSLRVDP